MWPKNKLGKLLSQLEAHYGRLAAPRYESAFEMVIAEIVAPPGSEDRRQLAMDTLRERVGLSPARIVAAPPGVLQDVMAVAGGTIQEVRAERLREAARLVLERFGGNLDGALSELPAAKGKKALEAFPAVGDSVSDRILLFMNLHPLLSLDVNGVRVLARLGFGEQMDAFSSTYRSVRAAIAGKLPADIEVMQSVHLLLREHGRQTCLKEIPRCDSCVVRLQCPFLGIPKRHRRDSHWKSE